MAPAVSADTLPAPTLLEKMGGIEAASGLLISAVEHFYIKLVTDFRLAPFFDGINMDRLKSKQVDFLAYVFGGPSHYSGKDLAEAHKDLIRDKGLNETHFDLVAMHFRDCLVELGASLELVDEAIAILNTARPIFETANHPECPSPTEEEVDETTAITSQLQTVLAAQDQELATIRTKVRGLVQDTDAPSLERLRASLRLRGRGLLDLFDQSLAGWH